MSKHTHVWHGQNVDVDIYFENATGGIIGEEDVPVLSYCYWENVNVSATQEQTRRQVTGRAKKKITNRAWEYSASVEHMYFSKEDEINVEEMFSRNKRLRIEIRCVDKAYPEEENDIHILKAAYASRWRISGQENDILSASVDFEAEDFE